MASVPRHCSVHFGAVSVEGTLLDDDDRTYGAEKLETMTPSQFRDRVQYPE